MSLSVAAALHTPRQSFLPLLGWPPEAHAPLPFSPPWLAENSAGAPLPNPHLGRSSSRPASPCRLRTAAPSRGRAGLQGDDPQSSSDALHLRPHPLVSMPGCSLWDPVARAACKDWTASLWSLFSHCLGGSLWEEPENGWRSLAVRWNACSDCGYLELHDFWIFLKWVEFKILLFCFGSFYRMRRYEDTKEILFQLQYPDTISWNIFVAACAWNWKDGSLIKLHFLQCFQPVCTVAQWNKEFSFF